MTSEPNRFGNEIKREFTSRVLQTLSHFCILSTIETKRRNHRGSRFKQLYALRSELVFAARSPYPRIVVVLLFSRCYVSLISRSRSSLRDSYEKRP